MDEHQNFNEEEFLQKVEKAAGRGARKGKLLQTILSLIPTIFVIGLLVYYVLPIGNSFKTGINSIFHLEDPAQSHDLVTEDNGIFGYTAANFEEAILGDRDKLKKIEVMSQEVSDVSTATQAGFMNWGVFTKNQLITYHGTAVYTVDLSGMSSSDIVFDEENRIITMKIPHAQMEPINIPEDQIQFGDTEHGLLAFGDLQMSLEDQAKIQAGAREKMEEKLKEDNIQETADRFAKLTVWELYSPVIKSVARDCSLEVEFK